MSNELAIVMPVYNEEGIIEHVIKSWVETLNNLKIDFKIYTFNDGSKDNSGKILDELATKYSSLENINKNNSGHGSTILQGYRYAADKSTWIFQLDSDNEISPEHFEKLWNKREQNDFIMGKRIGRNLSLGRKLMTLSARTIIKVFYGFSHPYDVNCPYRLMRSSVFKEYFSKIPQNTFAPNVIISGIVAKDKMSFDQVPVEFTYRETGVVSISSFKLVTISLKSIRETISFRFS